MLMEPDGLSGRKLLRLLHLGLGETREWQPRIMIAVQVSLLLGIAVLWRKLVVHFESYPWALAPAFDTKRTRAARQSTIERFSRRQRVV